MTTYKVSPNGDGTDGSTWGKAYQTITVARIAHIENGAIFEIDGGSSGVTYTEGTGTSDINQTFEGSLESGHNGLVTVDASGSAAHGMACQHAGFTLANMEIINSDTDKFGVLATPTAGNTGTILNVTIDKCDRGIYFGDGTTAISNLQIKNTKGLYTWYAIKAAAVVNIEYAKFIDNAGAFYVTNGTYTISQSIWAGNAQAAVLVDGDNNQTVTINNSILVANGIGGNSLTLVNTSSNATTVCNNSLVLANSQNPQTYTWSPAWTMNDCIHTSPGFLQNQAAKFVIAFDDTASFDAWKAVADYAEPKGIRVDISIDTDSVTDEQWAILNTYVAHGHGVSLHTAKHADNMLARIGLNIQGPANSTFSIAINDSADDSDLWTGTLTCKVSAIAVETFDISKIGSYSTMADLVTGIKAIAGAGWASTSEVTGNNHGALNSIGLADTTDVVCTSSTEVLFDNNRHYFIEIAEAKAVIETKIQGYECKVFVPPWNQTDETLQAWLSSDSHGMFAKAGTTPFLGSTSALTGSYTLDDTYLLNENTEPGLRAFQMSRFLVSYFIGTSDHVLRAASILSMATHIPCAIIFYDHTFIDYSLADWQEFVDALVETKANNVSYNSLIDYVRQGTDVDGDGTRWTRAALSGLGYTLSPTSAGIDAGLHVPSLYGVKDPAGKPIHDKNNIGIDQDAGARRRRSGRLMDVFRP